MTETKETKETTQAAETVREFADLILLAAKKRQLKKAVLSKPCDTADKRAELTLRRIGGRDRLQAEKFRADNKALHENLPTEMSDGLLDLLAGYGQVNLLTAVGECELRRGKRGTTTVLGGEKLRKRLDAVQTDGEAVSENDRDKQYILRGDEPFLRLLDICDERGRVRDKRQAKFRQINRFLELVRDCLGDLPAEGPLRICDLCCGKSYLSFATYHYFANILGREVRMTGVDLKPDVIAYCAEVAKRLRWDGLEFRCGDVSRYNAGDAVDLVISLHACDIATDFVLERAVAWRAKVILSTPCCHHELNHHIDCAALSFITEHSMLRQKLCDAATDALRLKYLEAHGYRVSAPELIDPEETPKNIMLRGIREQEPSPARMEAAKMAYLDARNFLTGGRGDVQKILCPNVWG